MGERYNAGLDIPIHKAWTIRDNKWRAARYGLEAEIIRDEEGNLMSLRRSLGDLVQTLSPIAERLGCHDDLLRVNEILDRGTSASRQREVFAETHDLTRVVDALVEEFKTGTPRPLADHSLPGGGPVHGTAMRGEN